MNTLKDKYQVFSEYGTPVTEVGDTAEAVIDVACRNAGEPNWEACEKHGLCLGQFEVKWLKGWKASEAKKP